MPGASGASSGDASRIRERMPQHALDRVARHAAGPQQRRRAGA